MREARFAILLPSCTLCYRRRAPHYAAPPGFDVSHTDFAFWMNSIHFPLEKHGVTRMTNYLAVAQLLNWGYLIFFIITLIIVFSNGSSISYASRESLWLYGLVPLFIGLIIGALQHHYQLRLNVAVVAMKSFLDGHVNPRMLQLGFKWQVRLRGGVRDEDVSHRRLVCVQLEQAAQRRYSCIIGTWLPVYEVHVLPAVAIVPVDASGAPLADATTVQLDVSNVAGYVIAKFLAETPNGMVAAKPRSASGTASAAGAQSVSIELAPIVIPVSPHARTASVTQPPRKASSATIPPPASVMVNPLAATHATSPVSRHGTASPDTSRSRTSSMPRTVSTSAVMQAEFAELVTSLTKCTTEAAVLAALQRIMELATTTPGAVPSNGSSVFSQHMGSLLTSRPALITEPVNEMFDSVSRLIGTAITTRMRGRS